MSLEAQLGIVLLGVFLAVGVVELLEGIEARARRRLSESIMWIRDGRRAR
jgi:hypothetical protein